MQDSYAHMEKFHESASVISFAVLCNDHGLVPGQCCGWKLSHGFSSWHLDLMTLRVSISTQALRSGGVGVVTE